MNKRSIRACAIALAVLAWPSGVRALDIDMYTLQAPAKPNVILFVDDTRPLLRRAYWGGAAQYTDCYRNIGACPAACNNKCPFRYLGLQKNGINFNAGDCDLNNDPLKSLYPSAYFQANWNAGLNQCEVSLLNPADDPGWSWNPVIIPRDNYNTDDKIDQFNFLTTTYYSALQALLSKSGSAGQVGLMLNNMMGNDYRFGFSIFNDLIGADGQGGCIMPVSNNNGVRDTSTTDCGNTAAEQDPTTGRRVAAACELDRVFLTEAGLNKLPKAWEPYSEVGVEMMVYYHGTFPVYCPKVPGPYKTPWGNGDPWAIQYDAATQAYLGNNAFTLMLALGAPSQEDAYADSNGDGVTVDAVVTYPNGGTHWLDDVMLDNYRYDIIADPEAAFAAAGFPDATWTAGFNRKCQYLGWANNPPPPFGNGAARSILDRQANCTRQTAATDVISVGYYNPLFELTASQAMGRYWPLWIDPGLLPAPTMADRNEITGYDCTAVQAPAPNPNSACWSGLSKGIISYMSSLWTRNVNTNRSYSIPTPVADIDRFHSFDCGANRYIVASFVPTQGTRFEGHLKAYPFGDQAGGAGSCPLPVISAVANDVLENSGMGYSSGGMINSNNVAWDAGWNLLSSAFVRRVLTSTVAAGTYTLRNFSDDVNITPAVLGLTTANSGLPWTISDTAKRDKVQEVVIDGIKSYWEGGSRLTSWLLGDTFHSQPVVVGRPNPYYADVNIADLNLNQFTTDPAYESFVDNQKTRSKVVFAGANDGALHAFYGGRCLPEALTPDHCKYNPTNEDGWELWAYVPNALLSSVKYMVPGWSLADTQWTAGDAVTSAIVNRPFGVDGSPTVADVWINQNLDNAKQCNMGDPYALCEWKTYLAGGLGLGGRGVYVLDVGDVGATFAARVNPGVVGEFTYGNVGFKQSEWLGYTTSDPIIGKVKVCNNDQLCSAGTQREVWVAMFGAGYAPESDPTDVNDSYDPNSKLGRAFIVINLRTMNKMFEFTQTDDAEMAFALAAPPKGADFNGDGYIDAVYVGDLAGQLWRFDMSQYGATDADITPLNSTAQVKKCDPANLVDTNCWRGQRLFRAPQPAQKGNPKPCSFRHCQNCVGCGGALACGQKVGRLRCNQNCSVCGATSWLPFWTAPAVAKSTFGQVYLFTGTGDRTNITSNVAPPAGVPERLYSIRDVLLGAATDASKPAVCETGDAACTAMGPPFPNLGKVVAANSPFVASGWFRELAQGEKMLAPAAAAGFNVFFTVFSPLDNTLAWVNERQYFGDARLYITDFMTGGSPDLQTTNQLPAQFWGGVRIGRDVPSAPKIVARPSDYSNPATPKDAQTSILIHTGAGEVQQIRSPGSASGRSGLLPPVTRVIYWRETQ